MAINLTEPNTTTSIKIRSVSYCVQVPNLTWDLNEATIPWILFPITTIASLATIFLNALIILAMKQKRELKKTTTILLASMAVADPLVGTITMPLSVATEIFIIRHVYYFGFCTLRFASELSMFNLVSSTLYHLTFIAWERYVAIRKWIEYKVIVTRERNQ